MENFTSGGAAVTVEWFPAAGSGEERRPAVLMMHGADGLGFQGHRYRAGARAMAAAGYHVGLVHYLDRTGQRWASFGSIFGNFPAWKQTLKDALTWLSGRQGVDPLRIGVTGISLGAALALATASEDPRIKAIVSYFGPAPQGVTRLPPTLVLHGSDDPIVPVANAHTLERILKQVGAPHEVHIYPGEGHGFGPAAEADAGGRILAFLRRHLGR